MLGAPGFFFLEKFEPLHGSACLPGVCFVVRALTLGAPVRVALFCRGGRVGFSPVGELGRCVFWPFLFFGVPLSRPWKFFWGVGFEFLLIFFGVCDFFYRVGTAFQRGECEVRQVSF